MTTKCETCRRELHESEQYSNVDTNGDYHCDHCYAELLPEPMVMVQAIRHDYLCRCDTCVADRQRAHELARAHGV